MTDNPRQDDGADVTGSAQPPVPTCYRHPQRESYIRCQRCGRYICPDCQRQAAVGFQCVECVRDGSRSAPAARTRFGGVMRGNEAIVTKILIGLNAVVFLLILGFGSALEQWLVLVGRTSFFADVVGESPGVAGGAYWRLITSAFVHEQIWHLAINMFSLWILGPGLEALLGRLRFTALYLVSALVGSTVAYAFTSPDVRVFGASGAIFGLFGATVVLARRMRADMRGLAGVLLINLVLNVLLRGFLSWQGHLGGFIAGLAFGAVLAYAPRERRDLLQALGFAALILVSVGIVAWRTGQLLSGNSG